MNENIIMLTVENYEEEVLKNPGLIAIDFYADWCAPCKLMAPDFAKVALEYNDRVRFAKINVDESKKLALNNKVLGMPTLLFFKDGKEVDRVSGQQSAAQLKKRIDALL